MQDYGRATGGQQQPQYYAQPHQHQAHPQRDAQFSESTVSLFSNQRERSHVQDESYDGSYGHNYPSYGNSRQEQRQPYSLDPASSSMADLGSRGSNGTANGKEQPYSTYAPAQSMAELASTDPSRPGGKKQPK